MRVFNVWIGFNQAVRQAVLDYRADGTEPANPDNARIVRFLGKTIDSATVEMIFNNPQNFGGTDYWLASVYYQVPEGNSVQALADELDWIEANGGTNVAVIGAWFASGPRNGLQAGQDYDVDGTTVIGTPRWPFDSAKALAFMPDIVTYDQDGNVTGTTPATEVTDVNLLQGQSPRNFTP